MEQLEGIIVTISFVLVCIMMVKLFRKLGRMLRDKFLDITAPSDPYWYKSLPSPLDRDELWH